MKKLGKFAVIRGRADELPFSRNGPLPRTSRLVGERHARLIVTIADQLQPKLDPRYITSIEERVFIEGPQRRIPDVWIQRVRGAEHSVLTDKSESDSAVIVEVEDLEVHETRIEILDSYNEMKLVALIEVVSPTNKAAGPGRVSYQAKQDETLRASVTSLKSTCSAGAGMFWQSPSGVSRS